MTERHSCGKNPKLRLKTCGAFKNLKPNRHHFYQIINSFDKVIGLMSTLIWDCFSDRLVWNNKRGFSCKCAQAPTHTTHKLVWKKDMFVHETGSKSTEEKATKSHYKPMFWQKTNPPNHLPFVWTCWWNHSSVCCSQLTLLLRHLHMCIWTNMCICK
jgi:hypothetical protein